jgi:hypothetical protein
MKKSTFRTLINEIYDKELSKLAEYSEEERAKMGIPSGAIGRGGKWYVGDKYAGKVVSGKFVPASDAQDAELKSRLAAPESGLQAKKGTSEKGLKIIDTVQGRFDAAFDTGKFSDADYNKDMSFDQFEKTTGITREAAKYYTDTVDDWEIGFNYDADTDSVFINDPADL